MRMEHIILRQFRDKGHTCFWADQLITLGAVSSLDEAAGALQSLAERGLLWVEVVVRCPELHEAWRGRLEAFNAHVRSSSMRLYCKRCGDDVYDLDEMYVERFYHLNRTTFERYAAALVRLHRLIGAGAGDDVEAEALREQMDVWWDDMSVGDARCCKGLSHDLALLHDPLNGWKPERPTTLLEVRQATRGAGCWVGALEVVRRGPLPRLERLKLQTELYTRGVGEWLGEVFGEAVSGLRCCNAGSVPSAGCLLQQVEEWLQPVIESEHFNNGTLEFWPEQLVREGVAVSEEVALEALKLLTKGTAPLLRELWFVYPPCEHRQQEYWEGSEADFHKWLEDRGGMFVCRACEGDEDAERSTYESSELDIKSSFWLRGA